MPLPPSWLPQTLALDPDPKRAVPALYSVFQSGFCGGVACRFQGREVWWSKKQIAFNGKNYDEGFWHIVSRDDYSAGERTIDRDRAQRLSWCAPLLQNAGDAAVACFNFQEGSGQIRSYIWLRNLDYVTVLRTQVLSGGMKTVHFLVTAFYLDGSRMRETLERKFEGRVR